MSHRTFDLGALAGNAKRGHTLEEANGPEYAQKCTYHMLACRVQSIAKGEGGGEFSTNSIKTVFWV